MMDYEKILKESIKELVREATVKVISKNAGYGIETEIKAAIKNEAKRLCDEDEEIKKLIRDQLVYWISKQ